MFLKSGICHSQKGSTVPLMHVYAITGDISSLQQCLEGNHNLQDQFGRSPLTYAAIGDKTECLELLLKSGCGINTVDNFGRTALHWAALKNSFRCLKLLLAQSADCSRKDNDGVAAIHLSAKHCPPTCMALLLKHMLPEEIDVQDNKKRTALHWSAACGHLDNIKLLVKRKSNIRIPDVNGKIPTHIVASTKSPDAVQIFRVLLENSSSILNWQDSLGRSALHLAIADGTIEVVKELISTENCNLNLADNMFRTPLHVASLLGMSSIVGLLVNNGANQFYTDCNGVSPLHYAMFGNHLDVIRALINKSFNIDTVDENGATPLMWAIVKCDIVIVEALLEYGANLHAFDRQGATPLHISASTGCVEAMELLLSRGSSVDSVDFLNRTALLNACELGHVFCAISLLKHGASLTHADDEGRSALHWAALGGHTVICQVLVDAGLGTDITDFAGRTPLIHATFGGSYNGMTILINNGANPSHADHEGLTALHWACKQGYLDAVEYLISCKVDPNCLSKTDIGKDRCTALDLAVLNDNSEVSRFILKHGGLSVIHIRIIAATKIQAYYRGYKARKLFSAAMLFRCINFLSISPKGAPPNDQDYNFKTSKDCLADISGSSVFESVGQKPTRDYCSEQSSNGADLDSSFNSTGSSVADSDSEAHAFRHLQQANLVKSVRTNRRFPSFSDSHYFGSRLSVGPDEVDLPRDALVASVSLASFSKLSAVSHGNLQESCVRHRSMLQLGKDLNPRLFNRFRRRFKPDRSSQSSQINLVQPLRQQRSSSVPTSASMGNELRNMVRDSLHGIDLSPENCSTEDEQGAVMDVKSFSSPASLPSDSYVTSDSFEIPQWCLDRALCNVAEKEWSAALSNYTFERVPLNTLTDSSFAVSKYL